MPLPSIHTAITIIRSTLPWTPFSLIMDDSGDFQSQVVSTIICEGDAIGSVVMYNREENGGVGETESKLARVAAGFLGRQMEQ